MNIDPLFMTIGLSALACACYLKVQQVKRKKAEREMMERALVIAARQKVKPETRGKLLAAEREWGLAEDYNPGKFWPQ